MNGEVATDSSLARYIGILQTHNPHLAQLLKAETEEEFVVATEGALEYVTRTIESGAKQYASLNERGLSTLLADLLKAAGYRATAERNVNGHVDVVIEHYFGQQWKYLGECKIHKSFQYHIDGCKQLLGYCTGRELRAFCLDFFRSGKMFEKLEKLRRRMDEVKPLSQSKQSVLHSIQGGFITSHTHESGRDVELLHFGCFVPKS
jgi:hypothetical protein